MQRYLLIALILLGACGDRAPEITAADVADRTLEAHFPAYAGGPQPVSVLLVEPRDDSTQRVHFVFDGDPSRTRYHADVSADLRAVRSYGPGLDDFVVRAARTEAWQPFGSLPAIARGMQFVERLWAAGHDGEQMPTDSMIEAVRDWASDSLSTDGIEMMPLGTLREDRVYVARLTADTAVQCVAAPPFNRSYPDGYLWIDRSMYDADRSQPVCRESSWPLFHPAEFEQAVRERLVEAQLIPSP